MRCRLKELGIRAPGQIARQGNARIAFQNVSGAAKVTQENIYYGHGLMMTGILVGFSSPPNKNL